MIKSPMTTHEALMNPVNRYCIKTQDMVKVIDEKKHLLVTPDGTLVNLFHKNKLIETFEIGVLSEKTSVPNDAKLVEHIEDYYEKHSVFITPKHNRVHKNMLSKSIFYFEWADESYEHCKSPDIFYDYIRYTTNTILCDYLDSILTLHNIPASENFYRNNAWSAYQEFKKYTHNDDEDTLLDHIESAFVYYGMHERVENFLFHGQTLPILTFNSNFNEIMINKHIDYRIYRWLQEKEANGGTFECGYL